MYGGSPSYNSGAVFEIAASGAETVLYSFGRQTDGRNPQSSLLRDRAGNLYGSTVNGGTFGKGTIFKVSASGNREAALYSFGGFSGDGEDPEYGLIQDSAGNFYGTTALGGAYGLGTIFEFSKAGVETVLHSFAGSPTDGEAPYGKLLRDADDNLYGTTPFGGAEGQGTVFELSNSGAETVLYNFMGGADGGQPLFDLVKDPKGNLYGTTSSEGASCACGTVFEVSPSGTETVLHTFSGPPSDGQNPSSGLLFMAGSLYGTTWSGGTGNCGTVFKITP